MTFNKSLKRFISILLSLALLLGTFPLSALALPVGDFDDEDQHANAPDYEEVTEAPLIEDPEDKYLTIYNEFGEQVEPHSETHYKKGGSKTDFYSPIVPGKYGNTVIEFSQTQTQEIRLEMLDEFGNYIGLIACSDAEGQWGIYGEDGKDNQWYNSTLGFTPIGTNWGTYKGASWYPSGAGMQKPIANKLVWDGRYYDTTIGDWIFPGAPNNSDPPDATDYIFHIRFQPTHEDNIGFTTTLMIKISYTEEAILAMMEMRNPYGFCGGDPVNMVNGNFTWDYTDFAVYGAQPLEFTRYYNALDKNESEIGYGWRHNYLYSVEKTVSFATLNLPDGNSIVYHIKGDGSFQGPAGKDYKLEADGNGYLLTDHGFTKYYFDEDGYLTAIEDLNGRCTEINRDGAKINYITNNTGTLYFEYAENPPLYQIGDVNMDGVITADDAIMVLQYCAGMIQLSDLQLYLADVNGDGVVDSTDAALILRMASGGGRSGAPGGGKSLAGKDAQLIIDNITEYAALRGFVDVTSNRKSSKSLNLEDALQMLASTVSEETFRSLTSSGSNGERFFTGVEKITRITDHTGRSVSYSYLNGDLEFFENADGDTIDYIYDDHRITEIYDFNSNLGSDDPYLTNIYDDLGRVTEQNIAGEGTTYFTYDFDERVSTITKPDGSKQSYYYDQNQNVISVEDDYGDPTVYNTLYTYEAGRITSITDRLGHTTYYNYARPIQSRMGDVNGDGRITAEDAIMVMQWYVGLIYLSPEQLLLADVNGDGVVDMTDAALILRMAEEEGSSRGGIALDDNDARLIVDAILAFVDPSGAAGSRGTVSLEDALQMLSATVDEEDYRSVMSSGNKSSSTSSGGRGNIDPSNSNGNIYSIEYPDATTELFDYNELNLVTKVTAKDGTERYYDYDEYGNLTEYTDAKGNISRYTYDSDNNMLTSEDAEGNISEYDYDSRGNMIESTDPLGNKTFFDYDNQGRLIKQTNADGSTVEYEYSTAGKLEKITNSDGEVQPELISEQSYEVNGNGYNTGHTDAMEYSTSTIYNEMNKPVSVTDAEGNTTTYQYDDVGQLILTTDAKGGEISYEYDLAGRIISMTDARNSTWTYEYDAEGHLTATIDPLNNLTSSIYDNMGRVDTSTNAREASIYYEYDDMGRTLKVIYGYSPLFLMGDVDGNGELTVEDAIMILQYEANLISFSPWQLIVADVNRDDEVNEDDANIILMIIVGSFPGSVSKSGNMGEEDALSILKLIVADPTKTVTKGGLSSLEELQSESGTVDRSGSYMAAFGVYTQSVYDDNGNLIEQYDKNRNKWSYSYDANNRMIESTDPLGNITKYEYNANGQQTQTLSPEGAVTGSEYDEMGRLILSTDPEGNITTYEYDALGRLVQVNYAVGSDIATSTVNEYNDNGWLTKATAQDGGETSYEYNKNGQISFITDAKGGVTEYVYDVLGRTVSVIDALNGETSYDYDENGNLLSVTDAMGGVTSYEYDELNRVISTTDAVANESVSLVKNRSLVSYDENGNVVKVTNVDEDDLIVSEITYEYDLLDRLISYTDAEENTFSFNHDNNGNTIREIDGRGNSTVTRYDGLDRAVKSYDQLGNFTLTEYDADGRMIKYTNAEGAQTNYEYDFNGNVEKITDALENETVLTYDSMNRVKTSTDARGALTTYTYTATGQVASVIDPEGGKKTYTYDLLGNLLTETVYPENNAPGNTTTYTYDALSRPLTVTNPLGHSDTFTYDALGRIKTVKDKNYLINNNVTEYFYDANGNLIETVDALGNSSFFDYDAMNRLVKVTLNKIDPRNGVANVDQFTFYQYDKRGLVTKEINAAENETIYVYDGNGNLIQKTDADGYVTEYNYDPRNLVNAINYDTANINGGKEAQFAYNKNGELIAMMDWNGTVNFTLDLLDRITSVNDQNKEVTSYTYDETGNQTGITYPDETVANYTYDLLGQLTNLNDAENHDTGYGYDLAGRLTAMTYPNGWEESYEYDKAGQLLEQIATGPGSNNSRDQVTHRYTYDPQGYILTELRTEAGNQGNGSKGKNNFDLTHKYDKLNR
ncbi:MAG: dockerin type I domain-containing protein, partial [Clostridiales bacterium]|nr:dockerin type I domain-containing protein [Clostridiales bacterium]